MTLPLHAFPDQRNTNQVEDGTTNKFGKPEQFFLQKAIPSQNYKNYTHIPVKAM